MNTLRPDPDQFKAEPITDDTIKKDVGEPVKFKLVGMRPRPKPPELPHLHPTESAQWKHDMWLWFEELAAHPHVKEVMNIPADEPIFVLRSQDVFAPETVDYWLGEAQRIVGPDKFSSAANRYKEMLEWQNVEPTKAKIPD